MTDTRTEPITEHWTSTEPILHATAAAVNQRLGRIQVADIDDRLLPFLAASSAELALISGIAWKFSTDDPAVLSLRLIAKVALTNPSVGGPHTDRLLAQLEEARQPADR